MEEGETPMRHADGGRTARPTDPTPRGCIFFPNPLFVSWGLGEGWRGSVLPAAAKAGV